MSRDLEGKVAVVTGAGAGLGRMHALQLASQGASVVVNDLGVALDGSGRDETKARGVVEEIEKLGARAVPHFGDAADWNDAQALIRTAVESFGDLDILINNAGFTRDSTLFKMSEEEFDSVVRVHLKGHFCPSKFACMHWRERSKAEGAPLFCPPGQPNYSAAKAGITSLTMGIAQLMLKYGVTANVVMPRARTRMTLQGATGAIFQKPEDGFDTFAPENVTPFFGYLASPRAERISGHLFIVWGKEVSVVGRPTVAQTFSSQEPWTVDGLHQQLGPHFEKLEPVKDGYTVPAM
jgi:3-oxoacyl-[acyl-carrier protein] reductase